MNLNKPNNIVAYRRKQMYLLAPVFYLHKHMFAHCYEILLQAENINNTEGV